MSRYGKRWRIALVLLVLLALAACGPRVPGLISSAGPVGTGQPVPEPKPPDPGEPKPPEPKPDPGEPKPPEPKPDPGEPKPPEPKPDPGEPKPPEPKPDPGEPKPPNPGPKPDPIVCQPYAPSSTQPQESTPQQTQTPTDAPQVKPDLTVAVPQSCTVARANPHETSACLFLAVDLRNQGQGVQSVGVLIESTSLAANAGLNEKKTLDALPEPKPTEIRVNIQPADFGQTHEVRFTADPQHAIEEVNEENNSVAVKLALPAIDTLPASAVCPPETTDGTDDPSSPAVEGGQVPEGGGSDGSSSPAGSAETSPAAGGQ
ncbi:CARDB domain-containing protein [Arthrobacter globiformis]|uniref:CARDB domain-containing protein n=1 Tax=Arthrobacter globiformis TaxID=1665 RepID=A0A328HMK0_ARTGO|nr:CARDB domain-containing protein [Arthrobacter globiformis]RAM38655.1 hypothetical protein DBZ45_03460 [Arthrobacter globiformis]